MTTADYIGAILTALASIFATWAVMRHNAETRKAEARKEGKEGAKQTVENFAAARQSELDALDQRRKDLDGRQQWFLDELRRMSDENRHRIDRLESRQSEMQTWIDERDETIDELRRELDRMETTLTQLKLQNDLLKRENIVLKNRIEELERKESNHVPAH